MIALLLLLLSSADATQIEQGTVACPVGGAPTRVHRLLSRNQSGWDSDGARYASSGQWRTYDIATCPDNLLSLYSRDMIRPLSAEQQATLEPLLAIFAAEVTAPDDLAIWDRYALAARTYEALGRDDYFVASVYLRGSWTVRDTIVAGALEGLAGPAQQRILLVKASQDDASTRTPAERKAMAFHIARIAHRAGLNELRDEVIGQLNGLGPHTKAEQQVLTALMTLPAAEAKLQDAAIERFDRVVGTTHPRAVDARFLLADLLRRRGRNDEAIPHYDHVSADDRAPQPTRELAAYLAAELRGQQPWDRKNAEKLLLEAPVIEGER